MAQDEFGFDTRVINVLQKKDEFINATEQTFFNSLSAVEQQIFKAVWAQAQKMNQEGGNVLFDEENIDTVNKIQKTIQTALQSSSYPKDVKEYLRSFENIKKFNLQANESVNELDPKEVEALVNPVQKAVVNQTLEGLTGSGVDTNFIQPVKEGIFKNVVAGSTMADLEKTLRQLIISGAVDSKLKRYVTQVSRDALNQFDGQVNSAIANEFGLDAYRYVGSLIDDSRPQCIRWAGKQVLLKEDLQKEISWATSNGTGMIAGTTPDNFATFRGGYNCRHSAIPFKLTASQRAKLQQQAPEKEAQIEVQQAQAKAAKEQEKVKQQEAKVEAAKEQVQEAKVVAKEEAKKAEVYNKVFIQQSDNTSVVDEKRLLSREEEVKWLKLCGIPEDAIGVAKISFDTQLSDSGEREIRLLEVKFTGDGYQKGKGELIMRTFYPIPKIVHNDYFRIEDGSRYKGKGAQIFANQVAALTDEKYKFIETQAARGSTFNGYYTWARLGYEPSSSKIEKVLSRFNNQTGAEVKTWGELLGTKTGQAWWKENGDTFEGTFDLTPNSYSQTTLKNYLESKGKPQQTAKEIEALRKAEEKARKQAEAEARRKAKEEERARKKAEAEAKRKAKEEERKRKAEEAARKKAEAEAKRKAKEEERARKKAEAEAKRKAKEEEKARKAEEKARQQAIKEQEKALKKALAEEKKKGVQVKQQLQITEKTITLIEGANKTEFQSFTSWNDERAKALKEKLADTHEKALLSLKEEQALKYYKGSLYTPINMKLRDFEQYDKKQIYKGATDEIVDASTALIRKVTNNFDLPADVVLFRGHTQRLSFNPFEGDNINKIQEGFILTDKAFRSSSLDPEVPFVFLEGKTTRRQKDESGTEYFSIPVYNKILARKGTKGYYLENVQSMSESEFLLPDDLKLKILSREIKQKGDQTYLEVITEIVEI